MKKIICSLVLALAIVIPSVLNAQDAQPVKGKRGGSIIGGAQEVYFEAVQKPDGMVFYPCNSKGEMLSVVPTSVDVLVVAASGNEQHELRNITLNEGCFKVVNPAMTYMPYMYVLSYEKNGQKNVIKYRIPGVQAR